MRISFGRRVAFTASAVAFGLVFVGSVHAQQQMQSTDGIVVGEVDRCTNGSDIPALDVAVGIQTTSGSADMTRTDSAGSFQLSLPAGQYTVVATADDGSSVARQYVPVDAGQSIDIGALELNAGPLGCGVSLQDLSATPTPTDSGSTGG